MKLTIFLLAAALTASVQAADAPPKTQFTRADPALRIVERSDSYNTGSRARWLGPLTITGRLVVEFDRAPLGEDQLDKDGGAHFEPDDQSLKKLPSAINYYPKSPTVVWLGGSGREVLRPLIGEEGFEKLYKGSAPRYEYPAVLVIKELKTEVECDQRQYAVVPSSLRLSSATVVAATEAKNIGC
jgi:hypothetical protein